MCKHVCTCACSSLHVRLFEYYHGCNDSTSYFESGRGCYDHYAWCVCVCVRVCVCSSNSVRVLLWIWLHLCYMQILFWTSFGPLLCVCPYSMYYCLCVQLLYMDYVQYHASCLLHSFLVVRTFSNCCLRSTWYKYISIMYQNEPKNLDFPVDYKAENWIPFTFWPLLESENLSPMVPFLIACHIF